MRPRPVEARVRAAALRLRRDVDALRFGPPVTHVYDPLVYAWRAHAAFIERFARTRKRVLFLGMNPGPFGMAQTGIPFGAVPHVRDWLRIEAPIGVPAEPHPRRPVEGFACTRREVSGDRVWGTIARHFGTPARFFRHHFIAAYCPLVFMEGSGRNRTPDKLPARERAPLFAACDRHLRALVRALEPGWVIGIGSFAEGRAREVLGETLRIGRILHPSPASPRANRGWADRALRELQELGLCGGR